MGVVFDWSVRLAAYRALIAGTPSIRVGAELGVSRAGVVKWAKLVGMSFIEGRFGGIVQPRDRVSGGGSGSYRRLTRADRAFIEQALAAPRPWSLRQIAGHLGFSVSTISREVSRNRLPYGDEYRYSADVAHYRAQLARHADRPKKLDHPVLRARVVGLLNEGWAPDAVAGRLKLDFPDQPEMHVSHETIYQALYVQGKGGLRHELTVEKALRSGRTSRRPQSKLPRRSARPWLAGARLSDRPAEAADRAVPGHWEGDLVVGPNNSGIITLVERRSRFALLGRLPGSRDSVTVTSRMVDMVRTLPRALFTTVTWDQGAEMAQHVDFTIATGCEVFFCDPHSPWQRGSNEQFNGLLRDFFPKGTDFNHVTDDDLARAQHLLNTRARKTLDYWTPSEKLREAIGVALET
ncbi:IS30 family transposase [Microbacterium halophytorum]